jgi:hypothetical protein
MADIAETLVAVEVEEVECEGFAARVKDGVRLQNLGQCFGFLVVLGRSSPSLADALLADMPKPRLVLVGSPEVPLRFLLPALDTHHGPAHGVWIGPPPTESVALLPDRALNVAASRTP